MIPLLNCVVRTFSCVSVRRHYYCPAVKRFLEVSKFLSLIVTLSPTGSETVVYVYTDAKTTTVTFLVGKCNPQK